MQVIALEDIAEFAALALADPARYAGRTLELAGDEPTPVEAAAAISEAAGIPLRYEQLTEAEAAAISPDIAGCGKRWEAGRPLARGHRGAARHPPRDCAPWPTGWPSPAPPPSAPATAPAPGR